MEIGRKESPNFVCNLDPSVEPRGKVVPDVDESVAVKLDWRYWGIVIGLEHLQSQDETLFFLPWETGLFVYHTHR